MNLIAVLGIVLVAISLTVVITLLSGWEWFGMRLIRVDCLARRRHEAVEARRAAVEGDHGAYMFAVVSIPLCLLGLMAGLFDGVSNGLLDIQIVWLVLLAGFVVLSLRIIAIERPKLCRAKGLRAHARVARGSVADADHAGMMNERGLQ